MSLLDRRPQGLDWESARRQFRLSLVLAAAMIVAALALGSALPFGSSSPAGSAVTGGDQARFGRLATLDD